MKKIPTRPARIPPSAQKFITSAFVRPRWRAGMNSEIADATAEYSPPTPSPVRNRNTRKIA